MKDFVKIYNSNEYGQIVAMAKKSDDGFPQIRFFCMTESAGVADLAISWNDDSEKSNKQRDAKFEAMDDFFLVRVAAQINAAADDLAGEDEA